jgi:hypothetical protein
MHNTHDTLSPLVERALTGNQRPLEFYLREQSRLPGPRANLELVNDFSHLIAAHTKEQPDNVRTLLDYLISDEQKKVVSNTPSEFVVMCGVVAYGLCAVAQPAWRVEVFELLDRYACNPCWRVRQGVEMAFQHLLTDATRETISYLVFMATRGNFYQQRASIAAIAEPSLLFNPDTLNAALSILSSILERLRSTPTVDRKREDFRVLRQTLGYAVSVITAATPEKGFALMRTCAAWGDPDVVWILRENLKKKRLAKFVAYTTELSELLA